MRIRLCRVLILAVCIATIGAVGARSNERDQGATPAPGPQTDADCNVQVILQADPPDSSTVDLPMMIDLRDTIQRRLEQLGIDAPLVETLGADGIVVELPHTAELEPALEAIQATGLMEIIDSQGELLPVGTYVDTSLGSSGSRLSEPGGPVYQTIVSNSDLEDAFVVTDYSGQTVVEFRLTEAAAVRFFEFTSAHIGRPMSIAIDKRVVMSAVINAAISDVGIIAGISEAEAHALSVQLRAGALPVPLDIVSIRTVCSFG